MSTKPYRKVISKELSSASQDEQLFQENLMWRLADDWPSSANVGPPLPTRQNLLNSDCSYEGGPGSVRFGYGLGGWNGSSGSGFRFRRFL